MQFEMDFILKSQPKTDYGPRDSKGHLQHLVDTKEHMIYLYGANDQLCYIRDHSSTDDGTKFHIMRKEALAIMGDNYYHHCNHETHDGEKAKVYVNKRKRMIK